MKSRSVFDKKYGELSDEMFCDNEDDDSIVDAKMTAIMFISGELEEFTIAEKADVVEADEEEPEDADSCGVQLGGFVGILKSDIPYPKSDADLDRIIASLKEDRKTLPERSELDEPNWKMIDAQIAICEWAKGE